MMALMVLKFNVCKVLKYVHTCQEEGEQWYSTFKFIGFQCSNETRHEIQTFLTPIPNNVHTIGWISLVNE